MNKQHFIEKLVAYRDPVMDKTWAFAPSNIALCKYWGKREGDLNLPMTPSLSLSLGSRGSYVTLRKDCQDRLLIHGTEMGTDHPAYTRHVQFLDLFRPKGMYFRVESWSNLPIAAGLASSASYFAALVKALDKMYGWEASRQTLSCLARLGSGSACRSLAHGFVAWEETEDPFLSSGVPIPVNWPELCVGLLVLETSPKALSSRHAMHHTCTTSPLYQAWCEQSRHDFKVIKEAVFHKDFDTLGTVSEYNALSMHATMMAARPSILYGQGSTFELIHRVKALRTQGMNVYLTQDAGPNIKLLFKENDLKSLKEEFPMLEVVRPFVDIPEDVLSSFVICVNDMDVMQSFEEKYKAHREKMFHRALSVMLSRQHNGRKEILLQKRHPNKYHSGGLWSNTCCSHPQLCESLEESALRCLREEVHIETPLFEVGHFSYRADFSNGTSEAEYDHVFVGVWEKDLPPFNPEEMTELVWEDLEKVEENLKNHPELYTAWFPDVLRIIKEHV